VRELVKAIDDFYLRHPLAMSEIYFFGTWADAATKKLYLDVNMLFQYNNENERREALIAANNSGLKTTRRRFTTWKRALLQSRKIKSRRDAKLAK
jgi:hypothetical protein